MQVPAIKTAKELGYFVIATDNNPNAPGFKYADLTLTMDTIDIKSHVKFVRENYKKYNIKGAFAGADIAMTVAAINDELKIPGISYESAKTAKIKVLSKKVFAKNNIPTPEFIEVKTIDEATKAAEKMGLPLIMKAVDSAASRGTKKLYSFIDVNDSFKEAVKYSSTNTALLEKCYKGKEYSVETIMYKAKQFRAGIVDRHFAFDPYPIETGHMNPTSLNKTVQEKIYTIVDRCAKSLNVENGPFKADVLIADNKILILEVTTRLSGGFHSQYTTPIATGMNPIKAVQIIAVGNPLPYEELGPKFNRYCLCEAIFPDTGKVVSINGLEKAKKIAGVHKIFMLINTGDIIFEYINCTNRICYVITSGSTKEDAWNSFNKVKKTIKIKVEK